MPEPTCQSETIIYTHLGCSDYLSRALECASISNPTAGRILIGDQSNIGVARATGWEYVCSDDLRSDLRREFLETYRLVEGKQHRAVRGGRDWIKYCFERYFIIEAFCKASGVKNHWFFDSDVMILTGLDQFGSVLRQQGVKHTRQCNNTCLKGYFETDVNSGFCRYITELFKDGSLLADFQRQYDQEHPDWAFCDMTAFDLYVRRNAIPGIHLESFFDDWWFDDAICQEDDFDMVMLRSKKLTKVKDIRFENGIFRGSRFGQKRQFAVLNCSWVPLGVFDWILSGMRRAKTSSNLDEEGIGEYWLGSNRSLRNALRRFRARFELRNR